MIAKRKLVKVPSEEAKPKASARRQAVDLALASCELWHARENGPPQGYASFKRGEHTEHVELQTAAGRLWLSGMVYLQLGDALSKMDLDGALNNLEAEAVHRGRRLPVRVRLADLGDRIFLDLADDAWRVVEVTAKGWEVIPGEKAPVRFKRPNGTEALPVPVRGGRLDDLADFIHTDAAGLALLSAYIIGAMTDRGPAAVLSLMGGQGTSKTTTTKVIQRLLDPRGGALRSAPRKDEDLAVAARNSWIVSFDNLSRISPDLSDGLARLSTGAAFATRQLYTNGEESIFAARRPVILNSIVDVVGRPDLLDRTVSVQLQKISREQRKEESIFWPEFEARRASLLGAALDALSHALAHWAETRPTDSPRMADFYHVAMAAGNRLPGGTEAFESAWAAMTETAVDSALEAAPIGAALLSILEAQGKWKASAADLLRELNSSRAAGFREHDSWPQTPQGLTSALRRLAPALEAKGWHVLLGEKINERRVVVIVSGEAMAERAAIMGQDGGMDHAKAERLAILEAAS